MPEATAPPAEAPSRPPGFQTARPDVSEDRLARETRYLVNEAFHQPPDAIAYFVSQRLAELLPDRACVESREFAFVPVLYAGAGHCSMRMKTAPYPHHLMHWEETAESLGEVKNYLQQGWCEFEWQECHLEVLTMCWSSDGRTLRHCFILADKQEVAVRFLQTVCAWNAKPRDELLVFDGRHWEKDEDLFRSIKDATLDNLVLPVGMKEEILADLGDFFAAQETYRRYGVPWKRGVLFVGPPGNGKTHAVKGLINELGRPCLYVKSFRGYDGPDEYSINAVFAKARRSTPCILVFEDLDSHVTKKTRSYFLNELDGFAGNDGLLTLATTNHPRRLDPSIVDRPSRFDRKYHFNLPALPERCAYIAHWNASLEPEMQVQPEVIDEVAQLTDGFSFAYLKELCLSAVMAWIRARQSGSMGQILREQVDVVGRQTKAKASKQ